MPINYQYVIRGLCQFSHPDLYNQEKELRSTEEKSAELEAKIDELYVAARLKLMESEPEDLVRLLTQLRYALSRVWHPDKTATTNDAMRKEAPLYDYLMVLFNNGSTDEEIRDKFSRVTGFIETLKELKKDNMQALRDEIHGESYWQVKNEATRVALAKAWRDGIMAAAPYVYRRETEDLSSERESWVTLANRCLNKEDGGPIFKEEHIAALVSAIIESEKNSPCRIVLPLIRDGILPFYFLLGQASRWEKARALTASGDWRKILENNPLILMASMLEKNAEIILSIIAKKLFSGEELFNYIKDFIEIKVSREGLLKFNVYDQQHRDLLLQIFTIIHEHENIFIPSLAINQARQIQKSKEYTRYFKNCKQLRLCDDESGESDTRQLIDEESYVGGPARATHFYDLVTSLFWWPKTIPQLAVLLQDITISTSIEKCIIDANCLLFADGTPADIACKVRNYLNQVMISPFLYSLHNPLVTKKSDFYNTVFLSLLGDRHKPFDVFGDRIDTLETSTCILPYGVNFALVVSVFSDIRFAPFLKEEDQPEHAIFPVGELVRLLSLQGSENNQSFLDKLYSFVQSVNKIKEIDFFIRKEMKNKVEAKIRSVFAAHFAPFFADQFFKGERLNKTLYADPRIQPCWTALGCSINAPLFIDAINKMIVFLLIEPGSYETLDALMNKFDLLMTEALVELNQLTIKIRTAEFFQRAIEVTDVELLKNIGEQVEEAFLLLRSHHRYLTLCDGDPLLEDDRAREDVVNKGTIVAISGGGGGSAGPRR